MNMYARQSISSFLTYYRLTVYSFPVYFKNDEYIWSYRLLSFPFIRHTCNKFCCISIS